MAVNRCLVAAFALLFFSTGLRGETYEEWHKGAANQTPVPFKNWLPPATVSSDVNGESFSVFESPLGHLFGHLDFSAFPPSAFPLKVRFLYFPIPSSAVSSPPNGDREKVPSWDTPIGYVADVAPMGELIEDREIKINNASEARAIPVWSVMGQPNRVTEDGPINAYTVLLEVKDQNGSLLIRQRLIEAVAGATTHHAGLMRNNSAGDSYLKDFVDVTSVDDIPVDEGVYRDVKVLWLDDDSLGDARYDDAFWQKIMLGGTMVVGHATEVQELAQRLHVSPNERILLGGLWSIDYPGINFSDLLKEAQAQGQYDLDLKKGENPFQTHYVFGRKRVNELRHFSIWFLASFTLFEIGVIVGSLFWLQGSRRVLRWLLIPLSAIVYTAVGLIVVHGVVDFRPEVQIFQEVDSVEGWPETRVHTEVNRLGFEDGRASLSTPAFAQLSWFNVDSTNTLPIQSTPVDDKTLFSMHQRYGRFSTLHVDYWVPGASPCELGANRSIEATRPLRGAWIWDGRVWRNLGPMKPGIPLVINQAPVVVDPTNIPANDLPADPEPYQNLLPDTVKQMLVQSYVKSLENTDVGILLALDDQAAPDQMQDAAISEIHTQTLLVHQFKLSDLKP